MTEMKGEYYNSETLVTQNPEFVEGTYDSGFRKNLRFSSRRI